MARDSAGSGVSAFDMMQHVRECIILRGIVRAGRKELCQDANTFVAEQQALFVKVCVATLECRLNNEDV
jgi:hypothetical protein